MMSKTTEVSLKGKPTHVRSVLAEGRTIVVTGKMIKIAAVFDEEFVEGDVITDPSAALSALKESGVRADLFTFSEKLDVTTARYPYYFEWDNAAVADTLNYKEWWEKLPQETRKNVRKAAKKGVVVQSATFNDAFVSSIKELYDEMPIRQGRRFWHFGKDLQTIKRENSSYLDRSEFIGAYCNGELIGFMKFVRVGKIANMMQILSKSAHFDKRPMNALIAKAVEICQAKGLSSLVYSKFTYGNKTQSQIGEFKRRNGFVQKNFPRYFIPLTIKGKLALRLKLHLGLLGILPSWLVEWLWQLRAAILAFDSKPKVDAQKGVSECEAEVRS